MFSLCVIVFSQRKHKKNADFHKVIFALLRTNFFRYITYVHKSIKFITKLLLKGYSSLVLIKKNQNFLTSNLSFSKGSIQIKYELKVL